MFKVSKFPGEEGKIFDEKFSKLEDAINRCDELNSDVNVLVIYKVYKIIHNKWTRIHPKEENFWSSYIRIVKTDNKYVFAE